MVDKFYTPEQLATILMIHPRTVLKLINKKLIIAINVGAGKRPYWRIYDKELQRFMAENYEKIKNEIQ